MDINNYDIREKKRRRRKIETTIIKGLIIFTMGTVVGFFAGKFIKNKVIDKALPLPENALGDTIVFEAPDDVRTMIEENYYSYLKKAYIMFGEYPNCEYYKISAKVKRDDYDFENHFYVKEGEAYVNYYPESADKPEGEIAIDISGYQGNIEWDKVKAAGISVAIIRAGFRGYGEAGTLNEDENFKTYMDGATAAGIKTGVYFFSEAVNYDEGVQEAKFVLNMCKGYKITEPIVMDVEYVDGVDYARANDISSEDRTQAVKGFCETIKAAGYTPMIYATESYFVRHMNIEEIGDYEFWIAAYYTPDFPYHVEAWQYSPYGLVPGIDENNVDLNVWLRNKKQK
ncbi:MAG: glycoside hydrolase family 25 protein [Eubacterium sp.]|nr:glycoside hydrolase family 25 protein [Eubacterium sp.]